MDTFPPRQILVPTDFGECATSAMKQAFELAEALGAKVHVLSAYHFNTYAMGPLMIDQVLAEMKSAHERQLQDVAAPYRSSPSFGQLLVKLGDPRDVIVQVAEGLKADLIVMGTVGKRGLTRLMLGSVAESVVRAASCPVLVVRPPQTEPAPG